jgi:RNA polymerase sigma-70 factor (ECF subfamily)
MVIRQKKAMGSSHEDRFRRLVLENSPAVGNYLRRRLYPLTVADLDDLVEETMLVVWRRIDAVPADAELPWMIGVARNVLRNARRSQNRRSRFESTLTPRASDPSAEDLVIADSSVRDALVALSDDDREILMLNAWDGLDSEALGAALSISTNAAAVRLSRAQARFRTTFASTDVH